VKFFEKRRFKDARKQFLTTLRYSPDHKEAIGYLKNRLHSKEYQNYKVEGKETGYIRKNTKTIKSKEKKPLKIFQKNSTKIPQKIF